MPDIKGDIKIEEGMALRDFLPIAADKLVTFAIHLATAIIVFYVGRLIVKKLNSLVQHILAKRNVDPSIASFVKDRKSVV